MRVCVLSDGYPPWEHGGAQKIAAQLARGYRQRGHRVSVVTTVTDQNEVGRSTVDGVEVHRVYSPKPRALLPHLTVYNPYVVRPCRRLFDQIDPAVVHAHNCHWLSNGALRAAADGRPVVKTYHDAGTVAYGDFDDFVERTPVGESRVPREAYEVSHEQQASEQGRRYNSLRNQSNRTTLWDCVDAGVAVSRELRRALTANDVPCQRVIRNGVRAEYWSEGDGDEFRRRQGLGDARIVLFGGRTSEAKGGRHLARAVAQLGDDVADSVRLVVTGGEEFAEEMREEMGPRGDRLAATGWVEPEAYRDAVDAATVVASPSVFLDPFPTVNLEAFAASTPVVTTRFGGGRELVDHGENGFVVDPRDGGALTDALETLVGNLKTAAAFGNAGHRKVVEEFRVEQRVDAYLELLDAVRKRHSGLPEALGGDSSSPSTGQ